MKTLLQSRLNQRISLIPKTSIQIVADEEIQSRYIQLDNDGVEKLFIKFIKKGENDMPEAKIEIVSDVDSRIVYNEIYENVVDRNEIASYRAKIEALKEQKAGIEAEIAELEALVEKGESIVKLADEKKAAEEAAAKAEAEAIDVEPRLGENNVIVEGV